MYKIGIIDNFVFHMFVVSFFVCVTGPPGALSFDVKPEIARRITRTAVLVELPPGHLLHSFSCNSSLV